MGNTRGDFSGSLEKDDTLTDFRIGLVHGRRTEDGEVFVGRVSLLYHSWREGGRGQVTNPGSGLYEARTSETGDPRVVRGTRKRN